MMRMASVKMDREVMNEYQHQPDGVINTHKSSYSYVIQLDAKDQKYLKIKKKMKEK